MKKITGILLIVALVLLIAIPADAGGRGRHRGGGGGEVLLGFGLMWIGGSIVHHLIDAANRPDVVYVVEQPRRMLSCSSAYDCAYKRRMLQKEMEAERKAAQLDRELEGLEQEKGRNDADRDYRDYRY